MSKYRIIIHTNSDFELPCWKNNLRIETYDILYETNDDISLVIKFIITGITMTIGKELNVMRFFVRAYDHALSHINEEMGSVYDEDYFLMWRKEDQ